MRQDPRFPNLFILDHPLIQHKLSHMRDRQTSTRTFRQLLREALTSWPVRPQDIDGFITHPCGYANSPDNYIHDKLFAELGIRPAFAETMNLGGATYPAMVNRAAMAIETGRASAVLCIGAGKFMKPGAGGGEMMARAISDGNLEVPYGTFIPALYGLVASQYMAERNATAEDLARVAVSARKWALLNPRAWEKDPLTIEDVKNARPVSTPFTVRDCCLVNDGGGAIVVTTAERAKSLRKKPVYVLGVGECMSHRNISSMPDLTVTGAAISGPQAYSMARVTAKDVQVLGLYDAFTINPILFLEDLGFCPKGEGGRFVSDGTIAPGGRLPVNTNGGGLSYCHPGMYGLFLLIEAARQVRGECGQRQVKDCDLAIAHGNGGVLSSQVTVVLGSDATL